MEFRFLKKITKKFFGEPLVEDKESLNVAILYFIPKDSIKAKAWHDGFTSAVGLLEGRHNFTWYNLDEKEPSTTVLNTFDLLLVKSNWGWIPDTFVRSLGNRVKTKKALLISGTNYPPKNYHKLYDILFYETFWYSEQIARHPNSIHAFGIDTSVMKPKNNIGKHYDTISVGALLPYKRFEKIFTAKKEKILIVADAKISDANYTTKLINEYDFELNDFVVYNDLNLLYNQAKKAHIACDINGGGERAVLEARSCNLKVIVENDNPKLVELNKGPIYSHHYYANQLEYGFSTLFQSVWTPNRLMQKGQLFSGLDSFAGKNFIYKGEEYISIGNYCAIGDNLTIITTNHDYRFMAIQGNIYKKLFSKKHPGETITPKSKERSKGPVIIEHDVWIGDNVTILSGVKIHTGACIATGSVVTSDVEPYSIVGGVPSKVLKYRFSNKKIIELLEGEWWNKNFHILKTMKDIFFTPQE